MTQYVTFNSVTREVRAFTDNDPPEIEGCISEVIDPVVLYWPTAPSSGTVLTWVDGALVWRDDRTIEECKAEKNAEINQKRLLANRTSFVFAGKTIACDELSMLDIQTTNGGVCLRGAMRPGWPGAWKAVDNTYVSIPDVATWNAFYAAIEETGQANFDHSQALKAALAAATTNADVDAITW